MPKPIPLSFYTTPEFMKMLEDRTETYLKSVADTQNDLRCIELAERHPEKFTVANVIEALQELEQKILQHVRLQGYLGFEQNCQAQITIGKMLRQIDFLEQIPDGIGSMGYQEHDCLFTPSLLKEIYQKMVLFGEQDQLLKWALDKVVEKLEEMKSIAEDLKFCQDVNGEADALEALNRAEVAISNHGSELGSDLWRGEFQMVRPGNFLFGSTLLVSHCGGNWPSYDDSRTTPELQEGFWRGTAAPPSVIKRLRREIGELTGDDRSDCGLSTGRSIT